MKTTNAIHNPDKFGIDSSLQFKALDEIVSMIHSLTSMMNRNLPTKMTHETAYAIGDLNLLVNNLVCELEMVKVVQTKASANELSDIIVTQIGELVYKKI